MMELLNKPTRVLIYKWRRNMSKIFRKRLFSTSTRERATNQDVWQPIVGLEIHAQIATDSKLFSRASTVFANPTNSCVSYFDCAVPGTLPVLNKKCVEAGVLTALALSCNVNELSLFERKHYFYADLPAGFQITQQKKPLAVNGEITFTVYTPGVHKRAYVKSSKLKQLQLEQDSGRTLYDDHHGRRLIDLNRAGIPLMELVFEPDLIDGEEAAALVRELVFILQMLGTCTCKMEEGALRIDANVSVNKENNSMGARTEIKNMGSIRAVAAAVKYEINRQIGILKSGGEIYNETRGWNAITKMTVPLREKEERHDYRFMPETNLPPLRVHVDEFSHNKNSLVDAIALKRQLPELPDQIRQKLVQAYNFTPYTVQMILGNLEVLKLFNEGFIKANKLEKDFHEKNSRYIIEVVDLLLTKVINLEIAKKLLDELLLQHEKMPRQIVKEKNWFLIVDPVELEKVCLQVIKQYPKVVKHYKAGKQQALKYLLRNVRIITDDRADMVIVVEIIEKLLC